MRVGRGTEKKDGGGTSRPRAERGAEDAPGGYHGSNQFRFEKFGNEIRDGHGSPAQKIENAGLAEAAHVSSGLEKVPEIFGRRLVDCWRGDGAELREKSRDVFERRGEFRIVGRVFLAEMRDARGCLGVVVVKEE